MKTVNLCRKVLPLLTRASAEAYKFVRISSSSSRRLTMAVLFFVGILFCYVSPASAMPHEVQKKDTTLFDFLSYKNMFWYEYKGNKKSIESFGLALKERKQQIDSGLMKVRVMGYCHSSADDKINRKRAANRSNQVKSYFIVNYGMKEEYFKTTNQTITWKGLSDVVLVSFVDIDGQGTVTEDVLAEVVSDTSVGVAGDFPTDAVGDDAVDSVGEVYMDTTEDGELPVCQQDMEESLECQKDTVVCPEEIDEAVTDSFVLPSPDTLRQEVSQSSETVTPYGRGYNWGIKTNALYLAATVANLGVEFSAGKHFSVDVPVMYSPYTVARKYRMRFLVVQPEFRYWLKESMHKGHFLGLHLNIGAFNLSVNDRSRHQTPDGFYGAGLSYGYALPFAKHWLAEFTLGLGYFYTKYDTYYNIENGALYESGIPFHYFGPTKLGVSIVYRFGN